MPDLMKQKGSGVFAASDKVQAALLSGLGFNAGEDGSSTGSNCPNPNYGSITVDFTAAAWNTAAFQRLFAITGRVHVRALISCVESIDSAGHGATLSLGTVALPQGFIKNTDEELIETGEIWNNDTVGADPLQPAIAKIGSFNNCVIDIVSNGENLGITIAGEAMTTGSLAVEYVWEAMSIGATLTEGAGEAN